MTLGKLQQTWPRVPDERQVKHIANIRDACEILRVVMHDAEGSAQPGDMEEHVFISKRMIRANEHLEIAEMLGVKAALE